MALIFVSRCRAASIAKNACESTKRLLALSSSVRSIHCSDDVSGPFAASLIAKFASWCPIAFLPVRWHVWPISASVASMNASIFRVYVCPVIG